MTPDIPPLVDLLIDAEEWTEALPEIAEVAEQAAGLAMNAAGLTASDYVISLLACDDTRIAALNGDFRGKPTPTNVLSWPAMTLAPDVAGATPNPPMKLPIPGPTPLGDVALALQTCQREAVQAARPLKFHTTHLILHGCLHLLGYDHETPEDAALMEGLEAKALVNAGWPDPYA